MAFRGSDRQFLKKLASKLRVEELEKLSVTRLPGKFRRLRKRRWVSPKKGRLKIVKMSRVTDGSEIKWRKSAIPF